MAPFPYVLGARGWLGLGLVLLGTVLALSIAACGSSKSGQGPPNKDASPDVEGGGGADGGDGGFTGVGVVTFSEAADAGGNVFAGFTTSAPPTSIPGCTVVDAGACTTTSCAPLPADAGTGDASVATAPNPGTLRLTGGSFGDGGVNLAPDKAGTYLYASPGPLFAPGDTLGVSAAGGELPGFALQTVEVLPVVQLTAPASDGGKITVGTTQPLTVSWTGGQAGATLVLSATAVFTSGGEATMTCTFDASAGTAAIPSTALEPLAAENAVTSGVGWYQATSGHFTTGPVAVILTAYISQTLAASFQ